MKKQTPYITYTIMVLCCFIYGIMSFIDCDDQVVKYILCGAFYKPFILAGDYYRLLTAGFVHANMIHLFVNMISLYSIGRVIEKMLGKKYIILLLGSVLFGNLFVLCMKDHTVNVGLSGGLYGLLACYIYYLVKRKLYRIPQIRNSLITMILMNLLINFMPGVSWLAHLGGFISGFFLSIFFMRQVENEEIVKHCTIAAILLCIGIGTLGYVNRDIPTNQIYYGTDLQVLVYESKFLPKTYIQSKAKKLDRVYQNGTILENAFQ